MTAVEMPAPVTLIPAQRQTLWGWPAVANFALGGAGAGLYVAAAVAARFGASSSLTLAAWLGPALVLAGFAAVAGEAGRPLRGPRVAARVRTSWMSRELWLGGAFVLLAASEFALPRPGSRLVAAAAAAALAGAQGFILWRARGVAAWDVPVMPFLFLSSALVSGTGLLVLLELGQGPGSRLLGGALAVLAIHAVVWWAFITWSRDEAFVRGVRALTEGRRALAIVGGGYLMPSFLAALALALPELDAPLAALAGLLMVGGQIHTKAALILQAGQLRPITLPHLRFERRPR